jgi:hypothetical protein
MKSRGRLGEFPVSCASIPENGAQQIFFDAQEIQK